MLPQDGRIHNTTQHARPRTANTPATSTTCTACTATLVQPNARLYTITDVENLHQWHVAKCTAHPMFEQLSEAELQGDKAAIAMVTETEEGKKVARAGNAKYCAVFRRLTNDEAEANFTGLF